MNGKPDAAQLELDRQLKEAQTRQAIAEALQKTAQADQARTEAEKAADDARRAMAGAATADVLAQAKSAAETRKTVAEADAAAVKAYLPGAPTLKPLEGTVTTDDTSGIIAETATYAAFGKIADKVADGLADADLPENPKARMLIVGDRSLAMSDWSYTLTMSRLLATKAYLEAIAGEASAALAVDAEAMQTPAEPDQQIPEGLPGPAGLPAGAAAAAALGGPALAPLIAAAQLPSIVGAAADVAGYFQSNYTISGREFEANAEALVAALAGRLGSLVDVVVDGLHTIPDSPPMSSFGDTVAARDALALLAVRLEGRKAVAQSEVAVATAAKAAATAAVPPQDLTEPTRALADAQARLDRTTALITAATAATTAANALITEVCAPPEPGGLPPLAQAALRSALRGDHPTISHVLYAAISSSGGETRIRQRRFFTPVVRYVGACVASVFAVEAAGGRVIHSGSYPAIATVTVHLSEPPGTPTPKIRVDLHGDG